MPSRFGSDRVPGLYKGWPLPAWLLSWMLLLFQQGPFSLFLFCCSIAEVRGMVGLGGMIPVSDLTVQWSEIAWGASLSTQRDSHVALVALYHNISESRHYLTERLPIQLSGRVTPWVRTLSFRRIRLLWCGSEWFLPDEPRSRHKSLGSSQSRSSTARIFPIRIGIWSIQVDELILATGKVSPLPTLSIQAKSLSWLPVVILRATRCVQGHWPAHNSRTYNYGPLRYIVRSIIDADSLASYTKH